MVNEISVPPERKDMTVAELALVSQAVKAVPGNKLEVRHRKIADEQLNRELNCEKARFSNVIFSRCRFINPNFRSVHFEECHFFDCTFELPSFHLALFQACRFTQGQFLRPKFYHANFIGCEFQSLPFYTLGCSQRGWAYHVFADMDAYIHFQIGCRDFSSLDEVQEHYEPLDGSPYEGSEDPREALPRARLLHDLIIEDPIYAELSEMWNTKYSPEGL